MALFLKQKQPTPKITDGLKLLINIIRNDGLTNHCNLLIINFSVDFSKYKRSAAGMKLLITFGMLCFVAKLSHQRSIIPPIVPSKNHQTDDVFAEHLKVKTLKIRIPKISDISLSQLSDKNAKDEKEKRDMSNDLGPFAFDLSIDDKSNIDQKFLNSIDELMRNRKHQANGKGDSLHIIEYKKDDDKDPYEIINKITEKYGNKHIQLYHIQSYDIREDDVVEYGNDIYIERSHPREIGSIYFVKVL